MPFRKIYYSSILITIISIATLTFASTMVVESPDVWSKVVNISNSTVNATESQVAVSPAGYVGVVWIENNQVKFSCLDGSGGIYQTPITISTPANEARNPTVCFLNTTAYIAWEENIGGTWEIRLRSWERVTKTLGSISVPFGLTAIFDNNKNSTNPKIFSSANFIYMVWLEDSLTNNETDREVLFAWYNTLTSESSYEVVTDDLMDEAEPDLYVFNGIAHVTYLKQITRDGVPTWHVYYARKVLVGGDENQFLEFPIFTNGLSANPVVAANSTGVIISWLVLSSDNQGIWEAVIDSNNYDTMVLKSPAHKVFYVNRTDVCRISVAADSKKFYIAFNDIYPENNTIQVMYSKSEDTLNWATPEAVTYDLNWSLHPMNPHIKAQNSNLYLVWEGGATNDYIKNIFARLTKTKIKEASVGFKQFDVNPDITSISLTFSKRVNYSSISDNLKLLGGGKEVPITIVPVDLDSIGSVSTIRINIEEPLQKGVTYNIQLSNRITDIWGDSIVPNTTTDLIVEGYCVNAFSNDYLIWPFTTCCNSAVSPTIVPISSFSLYPNPAFSSVRFYYVLRTDVDSVIIKIYSTNRELVKSFIFRADDFVRAGVHEVEWDLVDRDGHIVSNGLYFVMMKVSSAGNTQTKRTKLVVIKTQ